MLPEIQIMIDDDDDDGSSFPHQEYWRTRGCAVLFDNGKQCCTPQKKHFFK